MANDIAMALAPPETPGEPGKGGEATGTDAVFFVQIQYKGSTYEVPVQGEDGVASIFDFIQDALDFPRENCKLILKGKMLKPDTDNLSVAEAGLKAGSKVMLVASSAHDVSFVQNSRADPLVKGFAEEERDEAARRKRARAAGASSWGTKQDSQYRFNSMKAEFKYNTPTPFEAEKLLQRLATDPGIIDIMTSRRFTVGILTEMSPAEAADRMSKRGTPNMDLLGYNQNAGEMIVLKLRTDNTKGFRPYHDLINTLIHELTHNVWGPHDHNFWKLYGELKAQYMRFHRFWSHNGKAADGNGKQFEGFSGTGDDDGEAAGPPGSFGQVLGSLTSNNNNNGLDLGSETPRSRAARAAEARRAMGEGPDEPPKPNFLSGDGTWVFLCPCGQVHDPSSCPIAQAKQNGEDEDEEDEDTPMQGEVEPGQVGSGDPTPMEVDGEDAPAKATELTMKDERPLDETVGGSSSSTSTDAPNLAGSAGAEAPVGAASARDNSEAAACEAAAAAGASSAAEEAAAAAAAAAATDSPANLEEAAPAPARATTATATAAEQGPAAAAAATQGEGGGGVLEAMDLDLADLQAQGLDGASLWIANFSSKLRALRGGQLDVGLLLRLVQNVLKSPGEPKFRRIRGDNPKIRSGLLGGGAQAESLLTMLGFETIVEGDGSKTFHLKDASLDAVKLQLGKEILEQEMLGH